MKDNEKIISKKINGKSFNITLNDAGKSIKLITLTGPNGETSIAKKEDIQGIIELLNQKLNDKIDDNTITQIFLDSIIDTINDLINKKEIESFDDIKAYLVKMELPEDQQIEVLNALHDYYQGLMHSDNSSILEEYYNKTKDIIREKSNDSEKTIITFSISSGIVKQTVEKFDPKEQKTTIQFEQSFDYTPETKSHLITPLIGEAIMTSEPKINEVKPVDMFVADYHIESDNAIVNIKGCERSYADDLHKMVNEVKQQSPEAIKAQTEKANEYDNSSMENQLSQDIESYQSLPENEQQLLEQEKGISRKLVKTNNSPGHISPSTLLILILVGIAVLLFITFMILK